MDGDIEYLLTDNNRLILLLRTKEAEKQELLNKLEENNEKIRKLRSADKDESQSQQDD